MGAPEGFEIAAAALNPIPDDEADTQPTGA